MLPKIVWLLLLEVILHIFAFVTVKLKQKIL